MLKSYTSLPRLLLLLHILAGCVAPQHVHAQFVDGHVAIFEAPGAEAVDRGRAVLDKWNAQAASERGLVNALLGNTCFTTAIAALNKECSQLTNQQRCWLSIQFTMCFQRASGFKVLDCPSVCPRRRPLQSCVEDCTSRMDDKAHLTYSQFFGDVFNMCLFLQTQNFQQVTAALVQDMHESSAAANASLAAITSDLQHQSKVLSSSMTALSRLQDVQSRVHAAVEEGLREVKAVGKLSAGLTQSMNQSLELTGVLDSRQQQLLSGFNSLEEQHQAHAARAAQALQQLAEGAAALEERQAKYEALQSRLLNASESLLDQSQGMSHLLQVLTHYQSTGNTILNSLHSSSATLHDVIFYVIALSVPLVFWTHPPDIRLLLLAGVLGSWGCERAVLQHYGMVYSLLHLAAPVSGAGSTVHDVKLALRLVVMGGTLGIIVWLLAKRRAAERHREAVFVAIQQSMEEVRWLQQMAAGAAAAGGAGAVGGGGGQPAMAPHAAAPGTHAAHSLHLVARTPAQAASSEKVRSAGRRPSQATAAALVVIPAPPTPHLQPSPLAYLQHQHHQQHPLVPASSSQPSTWLPSWFASPPPAHHPAAHAIVHHTPAGGIHHPMQHMSLQNLQAHHQQLLQHQNLQQQQAAPWHHPSGPATPAMHATPTGPSAAPPTAAAAAGVSAEMGAPAAHAADSHHQPGAAPSGDLTSGAAAARGSISDASGGDEPATTSTRGTTSRKQPAAAAAKASSKKAAKATAGKKRPAAAAAGDEDNGSASEEDEEMGQEVTAAVGDGQQVGGSKSRQARGAKKAKASPPAGRRRKQ